MAHPSPALGPAAGPRVGARPDLSTPLEFSQDATSFVGYNDAGSFYSEDATSLYSSDNASTFVGQEASSVDVRSMAESRMSVSHI